MEGDTEKEADVKVILLGDSAVGKTKLVERYLMNDYHPRQVFCLITLFSYLHMLLRYFVMKLKLKERMF